MAEWSWDPVFMTRETRAAVLLEEGSAVRVMDMGMSARMVGEREVEQERLEKERQEEEKRKIAQKAEEKNMKCKEEEMTL